MFLSSDGCRRPGETISCEPRRRPGGSGNGWYWGLYGSRVLTGSQRKVAWSGLRQALYHHNRDIVIKPAFRGTSAPGRDMTHEATGKFVNAASGPITCKAAKPLGIEEIAVAVGRFDEPVCVQNQTVSRLKWTFNRSVGPRREVTQHDAVLGNLLDASLTTDKERGRVSGGSVPQTTIDGVHVHVSGWNRGLPSL